MNPILNTAFKAARKAGDMMIRASANLDAVKVDSKAFNDFVSDIDRQSESILLDTLFYSYPTHLVRSEEGGYFRASKTREGVTIEQMDAADVPAVPEYEWIIDPLDGTTNYLHGHPQYAISMALLHKGKLQEALVYAPERNDCYMASRGQERPRSTPPPLQSRPPRTPPARRFALPASCRSRSAEARPFRAAETAS